MSSSNMQTTAEKASAIKIQRRLITLEEYKAVRAARAAAKLTAASKTTTTNTPFPETNSTIKRKRASVFDAEDEPAAQKSKVAEINDDTVAGFERRDWSEFREIVPRVVKTASVAPSAAQAPVSETAPKAPVPAANGAAAVSTAPTAYKAPSVSDEADKAPIFEAPVATGSSLPACLKGPVSAAERKTVLEAGIIKAKALAAAYSNILLSAPGPTSTRKAPLAELSTNTKIKTADAAATKQVARTAPVASATTTTSTSANIAAAAPAIKRKAESPPTEPREDRDAKKAKTTDVEADEVVAPLNAQRAHAAPARRKDDKTVQRGIDPVGRAARKPSKKQTQEEAKLFTTVGIKRHRIMISRLRILGYAPVEQIAVGENSVVWRCTQEGRSDIAIKVPKNENFRFRPECEANDIVRRKGPSHRGAKHVVQPRFSNPDRDDPAGRVLATELMDGNLNDYLAAHHNSLPDFVAFDIINQVARGLDYLHTECNLIHSAVDAKNILLKRTKDERGKAYTLWKVGGLSWARRKGIQGETRPVYTQYAPEFVGGVLGGNTYSSKADTWSLSVVLLGLLDIGSMRDVPAAYTSQAKYHAEVERIYRRHPLVSWLGNVGTECPTKRATLREMLVRMDERRKESRKKK